MVLPLESKRNDYWKGVIGICEVVYDICIFPWQGCTAEVSSSSVLLKYEARNAGVQLMAGEGKSRELIMDDGSVPAVVVVLQSINCLHVVTA